MKIKSSLLLGLVALLSISNTFAQDHIDPGFYIGGKYTGLIIGDGHNDERFQAGIATAGYILNDFFSFELRLGISEEKEVSDNADFQFTSIYGAYTKIHARNSKSNVSPYLILGYTSATAEVNNPEYNADGTNSSTSYGIGFDYEYTDRVTLGIEYISYIRKNGVGLGGLGLGASYKF